MVTPRQPKTQSLEPGGQVPGVIICMVVTTLPLFWEAAGEHVTSLDRIPFSPALRLLCVLLSLWKHVHYFS